jgi:hypothetical protein
VRLGNRLRLQAVMLTLQLPVIEERGTMALAAPTLANGDPRRSGDGELAPGTTALVRGYGPRAATRCQDTVAAERSIRTGVVGFGHGRVSAQPVGRRVYTRAHGVGQRRPARPIGARHCATLTMRSGPRASAIFQFQ